MASVELLANDRILAARDELRRANALVLVASDPATVRWLDGGDEPGDVVLVGGDECILVRPESELPMAKAIVELLGQFRIPDRAVIAVDAPSSLSAELVAAAGSHPLVDISSPLAALRAVKDAGEIAAITTAAQLAASAQGIFRDRIHVDISERELSDAIWDELERSGRPVTAFVDLMFGDRCSLVGAAPTDRRLSAGETALFDFAPVVDGYWGDSCATVVAGPVSDAVRRLYRTTLAALETGIELLRPGVKVSDVDRAVRDVMALGGYRYPHLTGHGVGLNPQEQPLIRADNDMILATDMVVALEPGSYFPDFGVRLERVVHVRADGPQVLTGHDLSPAVD